MDEWIDGWSDGWMEDDDLAVLVGCFLPLRWGLVFRVVVAASVVGRLCFVVMIPGCSPLCVGPCGVVPVGLVWLVTDLDGVHARVDG